MLRLFNIDTNYLDYAIRVNVQKSSVRFRLGDSVDQTCDVITNGDSLEIEWYNQRGQLIRNDRKHTVSVVENGQQPLSKSSTLTILNANSGDAGRYECRAIVGEQRETTVFDVEIEDSSGLYFTFKKNF